MKLAKFFTDELKIGTLEEVREPGERERRTEWRFIRQTQLVVLKFLQMNGKLVLWGECGCQERERERGREWKH